MSQKLKLLRVEVKGLEFSTQCFEGYEGTELAYQYKAFVLDLVTSYHKLSPSTATCLMTMFDNMFAFRHCFAIIERQDQSSLRVTMKWIKVYDAQ